MSKYQLSNLLIVAVVNSALVACLFWSVKRSGRIWIFWMILPLLLGLTYLANDFSRVYSAHGFLHLSIGYQVIVGGVPPANPLLAGELLRYTWGPHLLVALLSKSFSVSPAWVFPVLNIGMALLTMFLLYRTALRVCGERSAAVFGVVISLLGFSFLHPIGRAITPIGPLGIAPIMKFTTINANTYGILSFSRFLFAITDILGGKGKWYNYLLLGVAVACCGFMYPV